MLKPANAWHCCLKDEYNYKSIIKQLTADFLNVVTLLIINQSCELTLADVSWQRLRKVQQISSKYSVYYII